LIEAVRTEIAGWAVSELAKIVPAPAVCSIRESRGAAVLIPGTYLAEEVPAYDCDRHCLDPIRIRGSVPELANRVYSPTVGSVIGGHATGMVFTACTDLAEKESAWHGHRLQHGVSVD
jgi:hypothetical protein